MKTFYLLAAAIDGIPEIKVYAYKADAYKAFHAISRRATAVLQTEPGHYEREATDDDATQAQALRDAAAAAVDGAAYVVVSHQECTIGTLYGVDGEADAARAYADIHEPHGKVMYAAGSRTPVDTAGDKMEVGKCCPLALGVLSASKVTEVDTTTDATASHPPAASDEEDPPAENVKPVFWAVAKMTKDGPSVTVYDWDVRAQREFNTAARSSPAALLAYPGNDVVDSAGDDAAVQAVVRAAAEAIAGATHVVVINSSHVFATVYPADEGAAARRAYDAASSGFIKALWSDGKMTVDAPVGGHYLDKCTNLARAIVDVAAATEAPAPDEGSISDEEEVPAAYWLVSTMRLRDILATIKVYATAETAQRWYDSAVNNRGMSAAVMLSEPGSKVLDSAGDAGAIDSCVHAAEAAVASAHRVVTWHRQNQTEAALFTVRQAAAARRTYTRLPLSYARSMWTVDHDKPVASYGRSAADKAAACALGKAIMTAGDRLPPVVEPVRYYTVTTYDYGQARVMAYDSEATARAAYQRLDEDTARAIAGQPGNTAVESSAGNRHTSVLPNIVFRSAAAAATSVKWVMVSRVWEHAEASLSQTDTASKDAAVAAYNRESARRARGVWGADQPAPVVVTGSTTWQGRCGALAAAILGKKE